MTSDKKTSDSMQAALAACPLYRWWGGFWFHMPPPHPRSRLVDHHAAARFGRHAQWDGPVYWGTPTVTALIARGLVSVTQYAENLDGRFPIAVDDVRRVGAEGDHDGGSGQPPSQGDPGGEPPCMAGRDGNHAIAAEGGAALLATVLPELRRFPLKVFGEFRLLMPFRVQPPRYNRGTDGDGGGR